MATVNISYLVPRLRLHLGDIDSSNYRHLDEWLRLSLVCSIEALQSWWNFKYLLDSDENVYRNSNRAPAFTQPEPPVIERVDTRPIILMAGLIIKVGDLENLSWNVGAWRDAEISYSNIEASRRKDEQIKKDWNELTSILKPPQKRLASARKGHLPGYLYNVMERNINDS